MRQVLISGGGGGLRDPERPLVHADDLGLLHGDGVFETMLVRGGQPCGLERHLRRFDEGVVTAGLLAVNVGHVRRLIDEATRRWPPTMDGVLRLVYTRGRESDPGKPTIFVSITEVAERVAIARRDGVRAVSLPTAYQPGLAERAPWLLSGVKSTSYAMNAAALRHAQSLGADDAVFVAADGTVLEGPRGSVVAVIDGALVTPRRDDGILPGTTQEALFELAAVRGIEAREATLHLDELFAADQVWLLSSVTLAARIRVLDGRALDGASVLDVAALVEESAVS